MSEQDFGAAREGPRSDQKREYVREPGEVRTRQFKGLQNMDHFNVPEAILRQYPHLSFQWNNREVFGQPDQRQTQFEHQQGWREVPHSMLPGLYAPIGAPGSVHVKEMVLVERPKHLTDEAREEELARARQNMLINQRNAANMVTPLGPATKPEFNSTTVPLEIPSE
jgi:hypothetical protein